jgi:hypothetical protein
MKVDDIRRKYDNKSKHTPRAGYAKGGPVKKPTKKK